MKLSRFLKGALYAIIMTGIFVFVAILLGEDTGVLSIVTSIVAWWSIYLHIDGIEGGRR